jgi:hypothetical protein
MSSLPFISHHLFVAAAGNESRPARRHHSPQGASAAGPGAEGPSASVEVLDRVEPLPARALRAARATEVATDG